jgi:glycine cleavage system regulatory protein
MSFFDSEVVRAEMSEISELQEEIYKNVFNFFRMSNTDKIEHVNLLQKLLQKQQILYTRLSLSDDPEAKEMKERVMESAAVMGLPKGTDINIIFKNMEALIDMMKGRIDAEGNS